jgi:hypothetical protein
MDRGHPARTYILPTCNFPKLTDKFVLYGITDLNHYRHVICLLFLSAQSPTVLYQLLEFNVKYIPTRVSFFTRANFTFF